ncbi:hypothetical protein IFM89_030576 [Coptis chinensis]|uniref:BAG domain-containing protein n=1 Tax=Coptis chinensis TaxID=261450 RepID=A0A835HR33_9MAGN|nr:hypothetical protein IFM89_030576 [Coptis chinensis]
MVGRLELGDCEKDGDDVQRSPADVPAEEMLSDDYYEQDGDDQKDYPDDADFEPDDGGVDSGTTNKTAKMEKAAKFVSEISLKVDKLAGQVSALESVITKGGKVKETDVLNLIELLMNQLVKLDAIMVDGDVKLQRRMQVKRVQKYVETLDLLKIRNSMPSSNGGPQTPKLTDERNSAGRNQVQSTPTKSNARCPRNQSTVGE